MSGITVKLPLSLGAEGDFESIKTYEDLVKQNLKNLILTSPGERPMDSNFGVGIKNFLFEQNVEYVYGEIESRILSQIQSYMPFLELQQLRIGASREHDNAINVQIFYTITPLDIDGNLLLIIRNLSNI